MPQTNQSTVYVELGGVNHYVNETQLENPDFGYDIQMFNFQSNQRTITIRFNLFTNLPTTSVINTPPQYFNHYPNNQLYINNNEYHQPHHQRRTSPQYGNRATNAISTTPNVQQKQKFSNKHSRVDKDHQSHRNNREDSSPYEDEGPNNHSYIGVTHNEREKRVKERMIGYCFDKVQQWRKYYKEGIPNERGVRMRVNLDQAAEYVGLSRKTLDDYHQQFKKA